ncbi:MAG: hypothetical protein L3J89_09725 [Gammaproteobacteria bacterium]|nr:hypothetical protein [Gammaproteobacteria bacterium]
MLESVTISRRRVKNNEDRFSALKQRGILLAQAISGDRWSDYNAHDPGVTILEQLCYAVTELAFHADADVADLLLNDDGRLDYPAQSLHRPEDVFPCHPTTLTDLCQSLLDEVTEIDNIWLSIVDDSIAEDDSRVQVQGLYYAEVKRNQDDTLTDDELSDKIFDAYHRQRNMAEDLARVKFLKTRPCILNARIEVDNSQVAEALLAEVYFLCGEYISGNIPLTPYFKAQAQGYSLEQLFDGPLTEHGLFDRQYEADDSGDVLIPALFTIINEMVGVEHIKTLSLGAEGKTFYEALPQRNNNGVLGLDLSESLKLMTVKLIRNGGEIPVSIETVNKRYQELCYRRDSQRQIKQDFSALYSLPEGDVKAVGQYTSIQEHFPVIYGINRYGASGESPERMAQTRQLKSYLLLFDQVMANFSASCTQLNKLYSTDNTERRSYGYQVVDESTVADIALIYPEEPGVVIANILAKYDHYYERKGRVLDYLLAIYGQKFTQNTLRYFNYYYQDDELEKVLVSNKIAFLESIISFDRDRAAGFNRSQVSWNSANVAGLQRRLSILLGFRHVECRSLTLPLVKLGLKVISHDEYCSLSGGSDALRMIDPSDISDYVVEKFYPVSFESCDEARAVIDVGDNIDDFIPIKNNVISELLLQEGVSLARYSVGSLAPDIDFQMVFKSDREKDWWYIGRKETRKKAENSLRQLHRFLLHLNIESEGLHLIEHLLLRPQSGFSHRELPDVNQPEFYSSRISVVFPAWTARCHDPRFRNLVDDSVRINCPAHLYADIYWLNFEAMYQFEGLYKVWLDASHSAPAVVDKAAVALIRFFHELACDVDE